MIEKLLLWIKFDYTLGTLDEADDWDDWDDRGAKGVEENADDDEMR